MIIGIGTDIIEISRLADWHEKPLEQLEKLFSKTEIAYCLSNPALSAQRFAVRFAAKEAFFKALTASTEIQVPFFTACKSASIAKTMHGAPEFIIDWSALLPANHPLLTQKIKTHVSLSHSQSHAQAFVILEI